MFSLVLTLYRTVAYGELKMESELKKEVLCEYEYEGRRRVVSFVRNEDVQKENEELLIAAKKAFSDLLSKESDSNYYL